MFTRGQVQCGDHCLARPGHRFGGNPAMGTVVMHPIDLEDQVRSRLAAMTRDDGGPIDYVIRRELPEEAITLEARKRAVDLIVMGTSGRKGVGHFLLGSVAETVARKAPCPVMLVRVVPPELLRTAEDAVPEPHQRSVTLY